MNAQAIEWYFQHLDQQGMALLAENYACVDERLENLCLQDPEAGAAGADDEDQQEIQWDDAVLPWMLDVSMDISDDEADEDDEAEQFCCDRCQGFMTEAQLQVHQTVCYSIPVELSLELARLRPAALRDLHPMEIDEDVVDDLICDDFFNDIIIDEIFNDLEAQGRDDLEEEDDDQLYARKRNRSNWMDEEPQAAGYVSSDCEEAEVYPMDICEDEDEDDDEDEVPACPLLQRATTRSILSDGSIVYNGNSSGDRFFDDVCSDDEELEPMV
jgi:hypothetical protein